LIEPEESFFRFSHVFVPLLQVLSNISLSDVTIDSTSLACNGNTHVTRIASVQIIGKTNSDGISISSATSIIHLAGIGIGILQPFLVSNSTVTLISEFEQNHLSGTDGIAIACENSSFLTLEPDHFSSLLATAVSGAAIGTSGFCCGLSFLNSSDTVTAQGMPGIGSVASSNSIIDL
jgi:hypothetical protein